MKKVGYSLLDENNEVINSWGNKLGEDILIPSAIYLPNGDVVYAPTLGQYSNYRLVERWIDGDITKESLIVGETVAFDGEKIIVTLQYRMPNEQEYADAIQKHINQVAKDRQYDDGVSLASYITSTNTQWKTEAETFVAWRDSVWAYAFNLMTQVQAGTAPQPSIEELINQLPQIIWPQ